MEKLIVENPGKVSSNKKSLERDLNLKISKRDKEIFLEGEGEEKYFGKQVITALDFGFTYEEAISIKKEDNKFEIINLKEYTNKKNMEAIRGRIIGSEGKALRTITQLTDCKFKIKENKVAIIGDPEDIKNARRAVIYLARSSKHANVYSYLEKHRPKPVVDLGLKPRKKNQDNKEKEKQ